MAENSNTIMATKTKKTQVATKITLKKNEGKKNLKPYCEQAEMAAIYKAEADRLRPLAAKELQGKLDADPETKDWTGTVVYLCDDKIYKVRVQRPDTTDWRKKTIKDPKLNEYKVVMDKIDELKDEAKQLEGELAEAHPKCVEHGFVISFLSK